MTDVPTPRITRERHIELVQLGLTIANQLKGLTPTETIVVLDTIEDLPNQ